MYHSLWEWWPVVLLFLSVMVFFYGIVVHKEDSRAIVSTCFRNVFIAPTVTILSHVHVRGWTSEMTVTEDMDTGEVLNMTGFQVTDWWDYECFATFVISLVVVIVVFEIIKRLVARNR